MALLHIAPIALLAAACAGAGLSPPPPPLRPKPVDIATARNATAREDCEISDFTDEDPAKTYGQRSVPEAEKLAQQGSAKLKAARTKEVDRRTQDQLITEAVDDFNTALLADPYNVTATYRLAAAHGRIGRIQCSINLLKRLMLMRDHHSRADAVAQRLDQLLGRNRQPLDPDFNDMRGDVRFRALIERMCERDKGKDCVLGTSN